jgi:signal transduction histidine kinase
VTEVGDSLGLPRQRIAWVIDVEPTLEVDADRDQLYRVLSNLCRNAVQALESEGERDGEIAVAGRREGAVTVIEVADTGPGVPDKARAHLFAAFQGSVRKGGTGLGLARQRRRRHFPPRHSRRGGGVEGRAAAQRLRPRPRCRGAASLAFARATD